MLRLLQKWCTKRYQKASKYATPAAKWCTNGFRRPVHVQSSLKKWCRLLYARPKHPVCQVANAMPTAADTPPDIPVAGSRRHCRCRPLPLSTGDTTIPPRHRYRHSRRRLRRHVPSPANGRKNYCSIETRRGVERRVRLLLLVQFDQNG